MDKPYNTYHAVHPMKSVKKSLENKQKGYDQPKSTQNLGMKAKGKIFVEVELTIENISFWNI